MHYFHHHHLPMDDDDISQHEIMDNNGDNCNVKTEEEIEVAQFNNQSTASTTGYRRIEEWNDEHVQNNPDEHNPLTHLKREKARWDKAFDSLNGGGI